MMQYNIRKFLEKRGWVKVFEDRKVVELKAPDALGFVQPYTLRIPLQDTASDFNRYVGVLVDILSDLYEIDREDLEIILREGQTILSIKLAESDTRKGNLSLGKFDEIIGQIKEILLKSAAFALSPGVRVSSIPGEAYKYLNMCRFLQIERESILTKIQLPSEEVIKPRDLFFAGLKSKDINEKFLKVLKFVSTRVFARDAENFDEAFIDKYLDLISIDVLSELKHFYEKNEIRNLEFRFKGIDSIDHVGTKDVTGERRGRLSELIRYVVVNVEEKYEKEMVITGKIIALKSKNPTGAANRIVVDGFWDSVPIKVEASLTSDDYKVAIEAHKLRHSVIIKGMGERKKQMSRFTRVDSFGIRE